MSKLCNQTRHEVIAFVLALAVQSVAHAQSAKTCIAYMEADAIYEDSLHELETSYPSAEDLAAMSTGDLSPAEADAYIHAIKILGPPENPAPGSVYYLKLQSLEASRHEAYRKAYDGPTSKIDSVLDKLIRIDRIRCRIKYERVKRP